MAMCRLNLFHYDFASVHGASSIQNCVSPVLRIQKRIRTVILQDVQPHNVTYGHPYATAEETILVREYPENYQK